MGEGTGFRWILTGLQNLESQRSVPRVFDVDLVEVSDRVAINDEGGLQSPLFEDRLPKASGVRVCADCAVGAGSIVLYDMEMEDRSRLDALSLRMMGERLPAGTPWAGRRAAWRPVSAAPRDSHPADLHEFPSVRAPRFSNP